MRAQGEAGPGQSWEQRLAVRWQAAPPGQGRSTHAVCGLPRAADPSCCPTAPLLPLLHTTAVRDSYTREHGRSTRPLPPAASPAHTPASVWCPQCTPASHALSQSCRVGSRQWAPARAPICAPRMPDTCQLAHHMSSPACPSPPLVPGLAPAGQVRHQVVLGQGLRGRLGLCSHGADSESCCC